MMKIRIGSHLGDHNCDCEEQVAEAVFNKLTGKTAEPLPQDLKTKVPDNFLELEAIWKEGKLGYTAFDEENVIVKKFDTTTRELLFMPVVIGG